MQCTNSARRHSDEHSLQENRDKLLQNEVFSSSRELELISLPAGIEIWAANFQLEAEFWKQITEDAHMPRKLDTCHMPTSPKL